ncbi:MAG: ATPase, T2SS/T4P/T4SS family [Rhodobacteraceae bacterium]|nr:ATPase, T2SS/T4P/T4SS family [Paracoccaceae bacterium]
MVEPQIGKLTRRQLRSFLMSCVASGASDITLQTDQQPRVLIEGILYLVKTRYWSPSDIQTTLEELYRSANALAEISGQKILDFAYEIKPDSGPKQRFRVNAVGVQGWDATGVEISIRILPNYTPCPDCVGLAKMETSLLTPSDGLVVVSGSTGSGKSSTLAAMVRHHLEDRQTPKKIVIIESPIEFTYRDITARESGSPTIVGQSEVGFHIPTFAGGVRSALRRNPDIIIIGEARDKTTITAAVEASLTGHLVYTTTHSYSVSNTIQRLLSAFSGDNQAHRIIDIITSLRVIMVQKLVPDIAGKQKLHAIREYLQFTPEVREKMLSIESHEWPSLVERSISDPSVLGVEPYPKTGSFQQGNLNHQNNSTNAWHST